MTLAEIARQIPKDPNPTELLDALRRAFELGYDEAANTADVTALRAEESGFDKEATALKAFASALRIGKTVMALLS
jgi:hypothetical protein